jgi:hypothetical protein
VTYFKLLQQIERDIRNQVVIDQMKRLNRRQKFMIAIRRHTILLASFALALLWILFCIAAARADEMTKPQCPNPGETCKVILLTPQEERILTGQNGILDTAAQGRQIDLGGFAVYFKSKIATAPSGSVTPTGVPAAPAGEVQKPPDAAAKGPALDLTPKDVKPN